MDRRSFLKLITLAPAAAFFGCKQEDTKEEEAKAPAAQPVDVRITTLKGPTAMGLAKFMSDVKAGSITDNSYTFDIVASPDEVVAKVAKGDVDIASTLQARRSMRRVRELLLSTCLPTFSKRIALNLEKMFR